MPNKLTEDRQKGIEAVLSAKVYQACVHVFETLEVDQTITGNGHHMAQKVADQAVELLKSRWNK